MDNTTDLTANEKLTLQAIRNEKFHSITLLKRNGEIERLETIERISDIEHISDVLKDHNYQNIEITQVKGRIVCLDRTIKTKLRKE